MWSQASIASNWVLREATIAYERGVLLNMKIEECVIPEPFATAETFDFSGRAKESIAINDVLTRELLRRIGEITESDFWINFENDDHPYPGRAPG
jgi:hypothetical protein